MDAVEISVSQLELDDLLREIARYLRAVDVFREEGHEPTWAREGTWCLD